VDTVTVSRTFDSDLEGMVARCRSLGSREVWPGAVPEWETPEKLYYQVSMRLKAATMTDIDLEETLGPVEHEGDELVFRTTQRCTWPDGVADGSTEYRFTPGAPHRIQLTYAYEPPTTKLVKTKDLPRFRDAMERVVGTYLDALTDAAVAAT
jgi:hypothetical protein